MHLSLPKRFPLFILASSVCRSLQRVISALIQGGKGGHLFRLTCSVVLWGGRNTGNKYPWRVRGALTVSGPHWVCPAHGMCAFPVYTAQAPGCSAWNCLRWALGCVHFPGLSRSSSDSRVLHKDTDSVGPEFCALPRSEQLRRPGAWRAQLPQLGAVSSRLPHPSRSVFWVYNRRSFSDVPCVSSGELISG